MKHVLLLLALLLAFPAHAEPHVVVSIKPLHALVAAVMEGDGEPTLLVQGDASPHTVTLAPSQVKALLNADIVFYIGDGFERFLAAPLAALPASAEKIAMERAPGMTLYPLQHMDADDVPGHDLHLWLAPKNAIAMTRAIEAALAARYPEHAALYHANAARLIEHLKALDGELATRMQRLHHAPFIVFHDAYQYFEKAYGLNEAGAITFSPELLFGARHLAELKEQIRTQHIACVFREPGLPPNLVENLTEGTPARSGVLDPEGQSLNPGPELYFQLMRGLAGALEECLDAAR